MNKKLVYLSLLVAASMVSLPTLAVTKSIFKKATAKRSLSFRMVAACQPPNILVLPHQNSRLVLLTSLRL